MSTVCVLCCSIGYLGLRMLHVQNLCFGMPFVHSYTLQSERSIQEDTTHRKASTIAPASALYVYPREQASYPILLG